MNTENPDFHGLPGSGGKYHSVCHTISHTLDVDQDFSGDFSGADLACIDLDGSKRKDGKLALMKIRRDQEN